MIPARPAPRSRAFLGGAWHWRSKRLRALLYQMLALATLAALAWLLMGNTLANMRTRGIQSGFDFLSQPAGFDIGEGWWPFDASHAYWQAFVAGLVNTLRVALPGVLMASVLGTLLGVGRFSGNALLRGLSAAYVELFRNIPLLLQLLVCYLLLTEYLPDAEQAWRWGGWLSWSKNGINCAPTAPEGGAGCNLSPEYLAVLLGLGLYTAAFVAEVVRAGIASVARGQHEASASLGLSRAQSMRLVVLPQALRVILPPYTNQVLNLTKNSSLAVAIGYPDVVSIANTTLNQTGRAVECIALIMLLYLSLSLATSALLNVLNRRAAIRER